MTIAELLSTGRTILASSSSSAPLDSELLLAAVLRKPRSFLIGHGTDRIRDASVRKYGTLLRERARGVPLPYLTGTKEFCGRPVHVTSAVLVPRPETEALAEEAVRVLKEFGIRKTESRDTTNKGSHSQSPVVADIGTGSGVLAITVAAEVPRVRVLAVDRSGTALAVARRNARRFKVLRRIVFMESDLLKEIPLELAPDVIVANLPYVRSDDLKNARNHRDTIGLAFEPQRALDGGPDGLHLIRRFFAQLRHLGTLREHVTHVLLEHSPQQSRAIEEIAYASVPELRAQHVSPYVTRWSRVSRRET
jgi:release factor glutamine methyltransferase